MASEFTWACTNSKFLEGGPPHPPPPNESGKPPLILSPVEAVIKLHSLYLNSWLSLESHSLHFHNLGISVNGVFSL